MPPLRLAIAEIRRECVNVEQRRLFAVGQGETITLEAFLERQRTKQQEVAQVRGFAFCLRVEAVPGVDFLKRGDVFVLGSPSFVPTERVGSGLVRRSYVFSLVDYSYTSKTVLILTLRVGTFSAARTSSMRIRVPSVYCGVVRLFPFRR